MSSSRVQELLLSGSLLLIGIGLILKGTRNRSWTPPPPKPKRKPCPKRPSLDSSKMIRLMSSDGKIFEVEEPAAFLSQTIKNLIEDGFANDVIPLPNVTSNILAMIIEYCRMHADTPNSSNVPADIIAADELRNWDSEFVDVNNSTLLNLILAANYLNISRLLNLTCQAVADMIKGKTPEELRRIFNWKNDFSPEELEEVRKENLWTFE